MSSFLCEHGSCPTCADEAVPVRIVAVRPGAAALGQTADGREVEVLLDLVPQAGVGDVVLVHAGIAIAKVEGHG